MIIQQTGIVLQVGSVICMCVTSSQWLSSSV